MDPTNKKQGASPHYSLYQRDVFKRGGEHGQRAPARPASIHT
jgi:hypothetical protein